MPLLLLAIERALAAQGAGAHASALLNALGLLEALAQGSREVQELARKQGAMPLLVRALLHADDVEDLKERAHLRTSAALPPLLKFLLPLLHLHRAPPVAASSSASPLGIMHYSRAVVIAGLLVLVSLAARGVVTRHASSSRRHAGRSISHSHSTPRSRGFASTRRHVNMKPTSHSESLAILREQSQQLVVSQRSEARGRAIGRGRNGGGGGTAQPALRSNPAAATRRHRRRKHTRVP